VENSRLPSQVTVAGMVKAALEYEFASPLEKKALFVTERDQCFTLKADDMA